MDRYERTAATRTADANEKDGDSSTELVSFTLIELNCYKCS